jgi:hypothetical protein
MNRRPGASIEHAPNMLAGLSSAFLSAHYRVVGVGFLAKIAIDSKRDRQVCNSRYLEGSQFLRFEY